MVPQDRVDCISLGISVSSFECAVSYRSSRHDNDQPCVKFCCVHRGKFEDQLGELLMPSSPSVDERWYLSRKRNASVGVGVFCNFEDVRSIFSLGVGDGMVVFTSTLKTSRPKISLSCILRKPSYLTYLSAFGNDSLATRASGPPATHENKAQATELSYLPATETFKPIAMTRFVFLLAHLGSL